MSALRTLGRAGLLAVLAAASAQAAPPTPPEAPAPAVPPAHEDHGDMPVMLEQAIFTHALLDQFEARLSGRDPVFRWEGQAWTGTDYDKLWLKTEGFRRPDGTVEDGRHELLYDRAISTYFDLQAGVRSDIDSKRGRTWGAFGIQGLAPLFFEVEATGYVSDSGRLAARLAGSYDLLLTQRLILQPEIELNLYSKSDPGRSIGSGLADIDTGLRLRYEFSRKFAPYVGVAYEGKFGQSADFARAEGESPHDVRFVAGIRAWF